MQESNSLLKAERLKEKLGKQNFHYEMEEVFEPVTAKQAEATKNQKILSEKHLQAIGQQPQGFEQALRDSSQTTVQAIQDQTSAIRESSKAMNKNSQKLIEKGIHEFDEITNRNNQLVTNLVISNQVDSSVVKTVSGLLNDKNKSQFSLEPVTQFAGGNPNLFTINTNNPNKY